MAHYGAKSPMFAPFAGGEPANSAPTYAAGIIIGKLVGCNVTPNSAEGKLPADNITAEYLSQTKDEDIALETDDLILQNALRLYGAKMDGNDLAYTQGDVAPYGGFAFYHTAMRNGVVSHIGHFFPKVRATRGAKQFKSRGDNIEFGTTQIPMKAIYPNFGTIELESEPFATEEAAYAWCASKLGISAYHVVNVQVQGETSTKYTDYTGKVFLPAGEDFALQITGFASIVAAYDNGVDVKTIITGGTGTYTVENIAADHDIVVVF
ncbi:MAG TPA: hypothetical protein PKB13_02705 [Clostridia bacterium]|nr:hypothetical protein [Clostridia bacterium]